jgi:hypothetical protein
MAVSSDVFDNKPRVSRVATRYDSGNIRTTISGILKIKY